VKTIKPATKEEVENKGMKPSGEEQQLILSL